MSRVAVKAAKKAGGGKVQSTGRPSAAPKGESSVARALARADRGERVVIKRGKKRVAAVISLEDLKLLEQLEDARDAELLKEALAEPGERVEAEEFFRRQGLPS